MKVLEEVKQKRIALADAAAILKLSSESRKSAKRVDDVAEQLVLVAGVGFEPTTFRL